LHIPAVIRLLLKAMLMIGKLKVWVDKQDPEVTSHDLHGLVIRTADEDVRILGVDGRIGVSPFS